ncbi:MAG: hypothetical protein Kow0069_27130 [Promethearchaeota archaeon]
MTLDDNLLERLNLVLWSVATTLTFIMALLSHATARSSALEPTERRGKLSWAAFFYTLTGADVLLVAWKYFVGDAILVSALERTSNAGFYVASLFKVADVEASIKRAGKWRGHPFSVALAAILVVVAVADPEVYKRPGGLQVLFGTLACVGFAIFPLVYFYVSLKARGAVRWDAFKISAGAVFVGLGYLFRPANAVYYRVTPTLDLLVNWLNFTSPTSVIIGVVLVYLGSRRG